MIDEMQQGITAKNGCGKLISELIVLPPPARSSVSKMDLSESASHAHVSMIAFAKLMNSTIS